MRGKAPRVRKRRRSWTSSGREKTLGQGFHSLQKTLSQSLASREEKAKDPHQEKEKGHEGKKGVVGQGSGEEGHMGLGVEA
ncbi:hypothetical protein YIM73052_04210 [Thermus antranikianii]